MAFYSRIGNFNAVAWCTLGASLLGFFMLVTGAILTGIAYTEITPPNYDDNYRRYQGANIMRIIGPMLIGCGAILLFGSCGFFAFAFWAANREEDDESDFDNSNVIGRSKKYHQEYTVTPTFDDDDDDDRNDDDHRDNRRTMMQQRADRQI